MRWLDRTVDLFSGPFVGLGTLMRFDFLAASPLPALAGLAGLLVLKTLAATFALRLIGLHWRAAWGMGLGLAQLGEFSFLVLVEGLGEGVIDAATYNAMLFIATGTLIATPQLLKSGLRWAEEELAAGRPTPEAIGDLSIPTKAQLWSPAWGRSAARSPRNWKLRGWMWV